MLYYLIGITLSSVIAYFFIRLYWLKMFQTTIMMRSPPAYMALPPLKTMMWKRFWVWEDTEFLPDPDCLRRE